MTLPHIPARFVKWMAPAVLLVVAGLVVWALHTSSDHETDAFEDTPAWTSPYSGSSTVFGEPVPVTPQPNDRTAVSFGSNTGGGYGDASTSSANPSATTPNTGTSRGTSDGTYRPRATPASAQPAGSRPAAPTGSSPAPQYPTPAADTGAPALDTRNLTIPPFYTEKLFAPLPGAQTRGVGISEWESYRTDVAGKDILVTTDDSNFYKDRNGKLNGNTGDTDASGLNVTDATDSTILGSESADEAPWQTVAQALVDILTSNPRDDTPGDDDSSEGDDDGDADLPDPGANPEDEAMTAMSSVNGTDRALSTLALMQTGATSPGAAAAVIAPPPSGDEDTDDEVDPDVDDSDDDGGNFDFPYDDWTKQISSDRASAVHTDDGTTLASGADALVVGGDGFDDDDNRAAGENITITRDDGNVVVGGTGDVNAQIGDSEQGAVIMGVTRTFIKGGGAY
jgi:hypothetical protein